MATETHYIRSYYDADKDRETLLEQTGQTSALEVPDADPWQTELSFGPNRFTSAPNFVPAVLSYEQVNENMAKSVPEAGVEATQDDKGKRSEISGWYKSLSRSHSSTPEVLTPSTIEVQPEAGPSASQPPIRRTKNNWFISSALQSIDMPVTSPKPYTLADILDRDPPSQSNQSHIPPVWIAIAPSNRGFAMMQNSGWREGEALGSSIAQRNDHPPQPKRSLIEVREEKEVKEFENDKGIIDLTMSDSEESELEDELQELVQQPKPGQNSLPHGGKALLTPIPTMLKSDRLGIGLKAKTTGPYKMSQKRVTHNAAALAAHVQANDNMRKLKAKVGRGSRGFAKVSKRETASRKNMLAYLNE